MTEAEARRLLLAHVAPGGLEDWIARQPWQAVPGEGWNVTRALQGWRIRVVLAPPGMRLRAWSPEGGQPAEWPVVASTAEG